MQNLGFIDARLGDQVSCSILFASGFVEQVPAPHACPTNEQYYT